jgi:hypothetical protein
MNRRYLVLIGAALFGVLTTICVGDDDGPQEHVVPTPLAPVAPLAPRAVEFDFGDFKAPGGHFGANFAVPDSDWSKVEKLANALGDAKDDKEKTAINDKLKTAIDKCFEQDMKSREGELKKLQQRLDKLKAQLDRRRKAKDDIVQLEVKVLQNEAAGLGFSHSAATRIHREIRKRIGRDHGRDINLIEVSP